MSGLSVEDFKNVLLDLYLAQRENAELHNQLAVLQQQNEVTGKSASEEATGGGQHGDQHPQYGS
jgi:hypothetical protein